MKSSIQKNKLAVTKTGLTKCDGPLVLHFNAIDSELIGTNAMSILIL